MGVTAPDAARASFAEGAGLSGVVVAGADVSASGGGHSSPMARRNQTKVAATPATTRM